MSTARGRPVGQGTHRAPRCLLGAVLVVLGPARPATAQVSAYYLNAGVGTARGPFTESGLVDLQRGRLMSSWAAGSVQLELAYEHLLTVQSRQGSAPAAGVLGAGATGIDWLPLQGTLREGAHGTWTHRVDRAALRVARGPLEITLGRQAIAWATTVFLSPADPFQPFDPSDPFREFRAGVDAARLRAFLGAFSEIDAVVRPADVASGTALTALARAQLAVGRWQLSGWGGALFDEAAGSAAFTVTVAQAELRGEGELRRSAGRTLFRGAVGIDRSFELLSRTLYVVLEYQRDGFGAAGAAQIPAVLTSAAAHRGELQVAGRDELAVQVSYQVHPLWSLEWLALTNLGDPSALLAPAVSYSVSGNASLRAGVFAGVGRDTTSAGGPGSEYGVVPAIGYGAVSVFF